MDCSSQSNVWEWICQAFLKSEPPVSWIEWTSRSSCVIQVSQSPYAPKWSIYLWRQKCPKFDKGGLFSDDSDLLPMSCPAEDVVGGKTLILRHCWFKCISFLPWNFHEAASAWGCVGKLSSGSLVWASSLAASLLMSAVQQFMWKLMHLDSIVALIAYFIHKYTWSFGGFSRDDIGVYT